MASDKLYEVAFKYKKTRLWNKIFDTQIFAVKFSDGEIGYINIAILEDEYNMLGVYVGEKAYNSYMAIATFDEFDFVSPLFYQEMMLQQDYLQCTFTNKDDLTENEQKETRKYTREHGINLRGRNAYPQFRKCQPDCVPWFIEEEQDEQYLIEALEAAVEMADILKTKSLSDIGIQTVLMDVKTIPLLEFKNEQYQISHVDLPEILPVQYIVPDVFNDINVAKLKSMKKKGIWECELIQYPEPIQNTPDEIPHFPMMFFAVESGTEFLLPVQPVEYFKENPGELIDIIVDAFLKQNICPKVIKVQDERSYHLLEVLCKKLKTSLKMESELPLLDDIENEVIWKGVDDEMQGIMDIFSGFDDDEIQNWSEELFDNLDEDFSFTNQDSETKPTNKKKGRKIVSINQTVTQTNNSYVISVSYGTGCYRHIQISENSTLFELHSAILCAFEFDDDHAHAFFMDNKIWSKRDAYYVKGMDDWDRHTCDYTLHQVGLKKGKQFKYVFDFGDEWLFQCKVLSTVDENTEIPFVKKSKGKAPEQYSDWD